MKKILIILFVAVAWIILLTLEVRVILAHDPAGYYARAPLHLVAVVAAAVGIAFVLQACHRLPTVSRLGLLALFWGAAAASGSLAFGWMSLLLIRHASAFTHELGWSHALVLWVMLFVFSWFAAAKCRGLLRARRKAAPIP